MKKEEFLKLLLARLIERGVPEETAKKETEHVRTYLTESGMEELDISLDEMADGIISMLDESSADDKGNQEVVIPIAPASESETESVSDELEAAIAAMDAENGPKSPPESEESRFVEESQNVSEIPIFIEPEEENDGPAVDEQPTIMLEDMIPEPEESVPVTEETAEVPEETVTEEEEDPKPEPEPVPVIEPVREVVPEPRKEPVHIEPEPDEDDADIEEFIPYDKKRRMKNRTEKKSGNEWLYVALLVVTIPIAVALILIAFVLYLGFWVALALAMIACIAVLIVFVTVGALVSLVGIVYGVVQLITGQVPVGLFEVGLGVIVGAAVMFVGILVYNFAVRFIPFGMKLLAKLFRAGFRAIRSGYESLKGAVDGI